MPRTEITGNQVSDETLEVKDLKDFAPEEASGLTLTVRAGRIRNDNTITDKDDQSVSLTNNTTNYVEINTSGVASANTTAFTSGSIAIAQVVTSGGAITSVTDKRAWISAGGGSGAPTNAQYVTLATDGTLTNERVLTAGDGIDINDAGAGSTVTVDVKDISASVTTTSNVSINTATDTALNFDAENFDTDTMHDTVTNNNRITINKAGKYIVSWTVVWAFNATGFREGYININDTGSYAQLKIMSVTDSPNATSMTGSTLIDLDVDDYLKLHVSQTSGGSLNVLKTGDSPSLTLIRVA